MNVRPITSDDSHARAMDRIEELWEAPAGSAEYDELTVLSILVEEYEERRWPISTPEPVEAIRLHMEQTGRTQADLGRLLGSRSRASEVLNRKRALTVEQIYKLSAEWRMPAEALIRPCPLDAA